jgi:nucleotide-binding universal stress UspA family protein
MPTRTRRLAYDPGHKRKYLVIVDESPEVEAALFFSASRISHSAGSIVLVYVIEPQDYQHWVGVRQVQLEEETNKAKALFRLFRRKLSLAGFEDLVSDEVIREGKTADEIIKVIEDDPDIGILVLGASADTKGPGPLVSSLATGKTAGTFPIPITIVPGDLSLDDLKSLA